ncbi:hypothetical protein ACF3OB_01140 [Capnocytophaga canis]|uniref:hypothetical protein n=1 Tax=Capnocytophaga canis TaxID=1848903 RepID=UPI00370DBC33
MAVTELYVNGVRVDTYDNEKVSFSWKANPMTDLKTRAFNASDNIKLPKTQRNMEIFELAGVAGSQSNMPYRKFRVDYYVDGVPIENDASGFINCIDNDINIIFMSGNIDLYRSIEGFLLKDLPMHELSHKKDAESIMSTHVEDKDYLYAIADYGGKTIVEGRYNFDYSVPSIKGDWIRRKIEQLSGKQLSGAFFESETWNEIFFTVSDAMKVSDDSFWHKYVEADRPTMLFYDKMPPSKANDDDQQGMGIVSYFRKESVDTPYRPSYNFYYYFVTPQDGKYKVTLSGSGFASFPIGERDLIDITRNQHINLFMKKNEEVVKTYHTEDFVPHFENIDSHVRDLNKPFTFEAHVDLRQGDLIYFTADRPNIAKAITDLKLTISILNENTITIGDHFANIKVHEWLKEVMQLFCLTPIQDKQDPYRYRFYTLNERVNAPVVDWSDKYVETKIEWFKWGDFARHNHLKFSKYNEQSAQQDSNDYTWKIPNDQMNNEKTITSKFFSPIRNNIKFRNLTLDTYEFWVKEPKEDKDGKVTVNYKEQNNRFHFFQYYLGFNTLPCTLELANEHFVIAFTKIADFGGLQWQSLKELYYADIETLTNRMSSVTATFNLSPIDFAQFDLYSTIYVKQLGSLFMPISVTYTAGEFATVEMLRISPDEKIIQIT